MSKESNSIILQAYNLKEIATSKLVMMLCPAMKQSLGHQVGGLQVLDLNGNNPHAMWLPWDGQPDNLRLLKGKNSVGLSGGETAFILPVL